MFESELSPGYYLHIYIGVKPFCPDPESLMSSLSILNIYRLKN